MGFVSKGLLLLMLALLGIEASEANDPACSEVFKNLRLGAPVFHGGLTGGDQVPRECCDGLKRILSLKDTLGGSKTCKCMQECLVVHVLHSDQANSPAPYLANKVGEITDVFPNVLKQCGIDDSVFDINAC